MWLYLQQQQQPAAESAGNNTTLFIVSTIAAIVITAITAWLGPKAVAKVSERRAEVTTADSVAPTASRNELADYLQRTILTMEERLDDAYRDRNKWRDRAEDYRIQLEHERAENVSLRGRNELLTNLLQQRGGGVSGRADPPTGT